MSSPTFTPSFWLLYWFYTNINDTVNNNTNIATIVDNSDLFSWVANNVDINHNVAIIMMMPLIMFFGYFLDSINMRLQDEHLLVTVFFKCHVFAENLFVILTTFKRFQFSIPPSNTSNSFAYLRSR